MSNRALIRGPSPPSLLQFIFSQLRGKLAILELNGTHLFNQKLTQFMEIDPRRISEMM